MRKTIKLYGDAIEKQQILNLRVYRKEKDMYGTRFLIVDR